MQVTENGRFEGQVALQEVPLDACDQNARELAKPTHWNQGDLLRTDCDSAAPECLTADLA